MIHRVISSKRIAYLFFAMMSAGCADVQVVHYTAPSTAPVPGDIHLSDAEAMDDLLTGEDLQVSLTNKLDPPDAVQTIYFGEVDEFDSDDLTTPTDALPLIAVHAGTWRAVPLIGSALENAGWKYVGAGPARNEIWGVLDTSAGDSQSQFVIAHSTSGGAAFTLKTMDKPCRLATVTDFAMSRNGHGRVSLSLDTDCGNFKSGLYHFDTTDDGKTWSKNPRYEPDAMIQADTVPDDESPALPTGPSRVIFSRRHRVRIKPIPHSPFQNPKPSPSR